MSEKKLSLKQNFIKLMSIMQKNNKEQRKVNIQLRNEIKELKQELNHLSLSPGPTILARSVSVPSSKSFQSARSASSSFRSARSASPVKN
jgi:hypothetical protein